VVDTHGNDEVIPLGFLAHREIETVEKLVLEDTDRVGVTDSSLQQTLGILGRVRRNDLKTRDRAVPGRVVLGVLSSDTCGEAVGATESDVARLDTTGHVVSLSGGVDDLVNGLHGEVEGHELANGVETSKGGTHGQTAETGLGNGRVDDTLVAEAVKQTFGDLVAGETSCQLVYLSARTSSSTRMLAMTAQSLEGRVHRSLHHFQSSLTLRMAKCRPLGRLTRRCTEQPPRQERRPSRSSPSPRPWPRSAHREQPSP
jgi:hypothetical protein